MIKPYRRRDINESDYCQSEAGAEEACLTLLANFPAAEIPLHDGSPVCALGICIQLSAFVGMDHGLSEIQARQILFRAEMGRPAVLQGAVPG
ncbi:hypothetical protein D3C81_2155160 [compost metagenome]